MFQFPLASFLDRFGILIAVISAFVVSLYVVGELQSRWKWLEFKTELEPIVADFSMLPAPPTYPIDPALAMHLLLAFTLAGLSYFGLRALSPFHEKIVTGTMF